MMEFDVFISYPHQDKATADAACATLEAAGVRCWIAPRDVTPGMDWSECIVDAIAGSREAASGPLPQGERTCISDVRAERCNYAATAESGLSL
jgi:hypothetical protein